MLNRHAGLPAFQAALILDAATRDDALDALGSMKGSIVFSFSLILIYGMFVPNGWRRTALVTLPIALLPIAVVLGLRFQYRSVDLLMARVATARLVTDNLITLLLGVVLASFGAHTIHRLRLEALAARELGQYTLSRRIGRR